MTMPDAQQLYAAIDATWPAARAWRDGVWTYRDGQGGGKRVSAATLEAAEAEPSAVAEAETVMAGLDQAPLFMIRDGQDRFDAALAGLGYQVVDPVVMFAAPADQFTAPDPAKLLAVPADHPLGRQRQIWAEGGIGPGRLAVMHRAAGPKSFLLARHRDRTAGAGFVAIDGDIAMLHALEIATDHRRAGLGAAMSSRAAAWAAEHGASYFAVLCTVENAAACGLYTSLGMTEIGRYHYRQKR